MFIVVCQLIPQPAAWTWLQGKERKEGGKCGTRAVTGLTTLQRLHLENEGGRHIWTARDLQGGLVCSVEIIRKPALADLASASSLFQRDSSFSWSCNLPQYSTEYSHNNFEW